MKLNQAREPSVIERTRSRLIIKTGLSNPKTVRDCFLVTTLDQFNSCVSVGLFVDLPLVSDDDRQDELSTVALRRYPIPSRLRQQSVYSVARRILNDRELRNRKPSRSRRFSLIEQAVNKLLNNSLIFRGTRSDGPYSSGIAKLSNTVVAWWGTFSDVFKTIERRIDPHFGRLKLCLKLRKIVEADSNDAG